MVETRPDTHLLHSFVGEHCGGDHVCAPEQSQCLPSRSDFIQETTSTENIDQFTTCHTTGVIYVLLQVKYTFLSLPKRCLCYISLPKFNFKHFSGFGHFYGLLS